MSDTFSIEVPYVRGSFTPTLSLVGGSGNTVPVFSTNTGLYVRVGRLCTIFCYFTGDGGAEGAGSGVVNVNLPIVAASDHPPGVFGDGSYANGANSGPVYGVISGSGSTASLRQVSAGLITNLTGANLNNTSRTLSFSTTYLVGV